jgi:carbon storage regulator
MLVLSRKKDERIIIGDNIEVTVIEIRGDRVKLGFVGPQEVPIHREEVFRRIDTCDDSRTSAAL